MPLYLVLVLLRRFQQLDNSDDQLSRATRAFAELPTWIGVGIRALST